MDALTTKKENKLTEVSDQTKQFVTESLAESTRRAYQSDLKLFVQWCQAHNKIAMPAGAGAIADFLSDQAQEGIAPATLNRRVAAIKYAHEAKGWTSPTSDKLISATLKGIRRKRKQPTKPKQAATIEKIIAMLAHCDTSTLQGKRDKALLLIGFAGAFRRSELAALTVQDIVFVDQGLKITIRSSKTDQEGQGQSVAIPNGKMKAVEVLQDWLTSAGITDSYLFRGFFRGGQRMRKTKMTGKGIADIVKRYAVKAGLDPERFAGHSLRSGFITSAAESGANLFKIMDQSRHKNVQTVRTYVKAAESFKDHAGSGFL